MPVAAIEPTRIVAASAEVEVVSVVVIALVGCRTPIAALLANVVVRRPVAVARSRKKNAVAVGAGHFITVYAALGGPLPGAFVNEFFHFCFGGQSPTAAPISSGSIVACIAAYIAHSFFAVGEAVF